MRLTLRAGALFAALLLMPAMTFAEEPRGVDLPHIKAALRLTPSQQPYWAPVEAVLHEIAHRQLRERAMAQASMIQRVKERAVTIILDRAAVSRLTEVARPLAQRLSEEQKRAVQKLAREMGLGRMLADLR